MLEIIIVSTLSVLMAVHGVRKKSLSLDGAVMGFVVGVLTGTCGGIVYFLTLFVFYYTSSRLTKYKQHEKQKIEDEFKEGGQRNSIQVISNTMAGTIACVVLYLSGNASSEPFVIVRSFVTDPYGAHSVPALALLAFVAHYSCCAGDTWASEVGVLSKERPYLITTLRQVPRGTNGGVSLLGLGASMAGGACVGLSFGLLCGVRAAVGAALHATPGAISLFVLQLVLFGALAGLAGSLVDSLLGATLQKSSYDVEKKKVLAHAQSGPRANVRHISGWNVLDNHMVNLVASAVTAVVMPVFVYSYYAGRVMALAAYT